MLVKFIDILGLKIEERFAKQIKSINMGNSLCKAEGQQMFLKTCKTTLYLNASVKQCSNSLWFFKSIIKTFKNSAIYF